jgi:hypothetical protein
MRKVSKKRAAKRRGPEYEAYCFMYLELDLHCWACGRDWRHCPSWWAGPWVTERAHIVNKPRAEDRRAVILLDSGCHDTQHGARVVGWDLPPLTLAHMLWIKRERDPQWYDPAFLQKHSVQRLPEPERPPDQFMESYSRLRG